MLRIDWITVKFDATNDNALMFCENWKPSIEKRTPKFLFAIFSGEWFTLCDDIDKDARDIIINARKTRGKITRIDFALDYELKVNYKRLYTELGLANPRHHVHEWTSKHGTTVYVGTRTSQRFLRCYNKRGEILQKQDIDVGFDWIRIELEVKKDAVLHYVDKWLVNPGDVKADIITRYGIGQILGIDPGGDGLIAVPRYEKEPSCIRFVKRYNRVIREALESNIQAFFDALEMEEIDLWRLKLSKDLPNEIKDW